MVFGLYGAVGLDEATLGYPTPGVNTCSNQMMGFAMFSVLSDHPHFPPFFHHVAVAVADLYIYLVYIYT